jgi:hypothetical protein
MHTEHESSPVPWLLAILAVAVLLVLLEQPHPTAFFFILAGTILVVGALGPVVGALVIWLVVRGINRRDDPAYRPAGFSVLRRVQREARSAASQEASSVGNDLRRLLAGILFSVGTMYAICGGCCAGFADFSIGDRASVAPEEASQPLHETNRFRVGATATAIGGLALAAAAACYLAFFASPGRAVREGAVTKERTADDADTRG